MPQPETHYRYDNAHEWLRDAAMRDEATGITPEVIFEAYLRLAGGDDIQNEFQDAMSADGFFDELLVDACHVCGQEDMTVEDYVTCVRCQRPVHSECSTGDDPHTPDEAVTRHICWECHDEEVNDAEAPALDEG